MKGKVILGSEPLAVVFSRVFAAHDLRLVYYQHGSGTAYAAAVSGDDTDAYLIRYTVDGGLMGYELVAEADIPKRAAGAGIELLQHLTGDATPFRERCRERIARKRSQPSLIAGRTVVFEMPLRFTNGQEHYRLTVVRGGSGVCLLAADGQLYQVNLRKQKENRWFHD